MEWPGQVFIRNLLRVIVVGSGLMTAHGAPAFWVWNRSAPLSEGEKKELRDGGVTTLYWHFAEITNRRGEWEWKKPPEPLPEKSSPALRIVPVIRLESSTTDPFETTTRARLKELLVAAFQPLGADEWQLDYDSPDRLIGSYANFLAELRTSAPRLSATALAGWVRLPAFGQLCGSVAEWCPMFYDLEADTTAAPRPLIEPDDAVAMIGKWREKCTVPWKAGLPWFSRLTLYGVDEQSRGHLRQWSWDDVIFRRELTLVSPTKDGVTAFRAEKSFALGASTVRKDETLVARWPDTDALARAEKAAAGEVVYFRLPDAAASSGGSLREFIRREKSSDPDLTLTRDGDRLVLTNTGPHDLRARAVGDGPQDRGYAVEVDAPGPGFREAEAGGFFRVAGHKDPDAGIPERVMIPAATRLTYWFSALPSGASLKSGIFQTAPAASPALMKYRVLNLVEKPPWKILGSSR